MAIVAAIEPVDCGIAGGGGGPTVAGGSGAANGGSEFGWICCGPTAAGGNALDVAAVDVAT
jgi:hypothetical protein